LWSSESRPTINRGNPLSTFCNLRILPRLDQLETFASETISLPMYSNVAAQAEEPTKLLADMRAKVGA
jgi:hypothetical protein